MIGRIAAFGRLGLDIVSSFGRSGRFLAGVLGGVPRPATGFPLLVKQLYAVGVLSLAIIVVSGLFIGMVLGLQGYTILSDYGSEAAIGQMIALTLVRELGPVVTALLFAGRAGSALTAEIGLMKATEQLSSMEMMGVDPLRRVIAPRLWAGFIAMPVLAVIFSVVGIWGGMLVGVDWLGVFEGSFWGNMQSSVDFVDDVPWYASFAYVQDMDNGQYVDNLVSLWLDLQQIDVAGCPLLNLPSKIQHNRPLLQEYC